VVVLAVVGVVLFLLTENTSLAREFVDKWTIANVAVFVVILVAVHACIQEFKFKNKQQPLSLHKP
jgi:Mn2+/Fe2+ NRAMP family transporter